MRRVFLLVVLAMVAGTGRAQQAVEVAGIAVPAGRRVDFDLTVPAGAVDAATLIPVTVLNGVSPGPRLLVVAGVHGYEFPPILAAATVAERLDPKTLRGTLVIVRVANLPSFEFRTPFVNPVDRKNLNRSFPGHPSGTQTERIAWVLSQQLIAQADFVIDVHSGDGAEWLEPFVGVYGGALAADYPRALAVARAIGFPNIVRYRMDSQEQVDAGRSLNRQAVAAGLPTLLVEIGQNGGRDPRHVETIVRGLSGAMQELGMVAGTDPSPKHDVRYFDGTVSATATTTGTWSPTVTGGRFVGEGDVLGVVRDHRGRLIETVRAPVAGYAIYGLTGPPVRAGDSAVTLAVPVAAID